MKLSHLHLRNFRCFAELDIELHPELTVLIAPNAGGKTALLDAARIAVWPLINAFDLGSQTGKSATIQISDVRLHKHPGGNMEAALPALIKARGDWGEGQREWVQVREQIKPRTNTLRDDATKAMTRYGRQLQERVRLVDDGHEVVSLPLVVYLGTGRLWYQGRYTSEVPDKKLDASVHSRLWGYHNCIGATSSYKQFEDWYGWVFRSYREQQIHQLEHADAFDPASLEHAAAAIAVVQTAVNALTQTITGWRDLQYSQSMQQQLVMIHPEQGALPLEALSDGLRNIVTLVADIAFRCVKLNPQFGRQAAQHTTGLVMIDEVDMFLHPAWQQRIISALRQAFPRVQFIVTTHSPQVLTTVPKASIRVLGPNAEGKMIAAEPLAFSYGEPSNDVLQAVMHVDPQPPVPEKADLDRLTELVEQGDYADDEAQRLIAQLRQRLNPQHPQLRRIERSIRRMEALKS